MQLTNPAMFQMARKYFGLTQTELSEQCGIAQSVISRLEGSAEEFKIDVVDRVASALGMPPSFFAIDGRYFLPSTPMQRGRTGLKKRIRDRVEARGNLVRLHMEILGDYIEVDDNIPRIDPRDFESPSEIARAVRRYLRLPAGPIENMTDILENNGAMVYFFDFGTNDLDAFTVIGTGVHPTIFANSRYPGERIRLNLAHELGHIVMHSVPTPPGEMEAEAWEFAGEFCVPRDEIYADVESLTDLRAYLALKRTWKLSAQSLVKRASDIGAITSNQARYLWMQINRRGMRKSEPLEMPLEHPTLLREVLLVMTERLGFSLDDLRRKLHVGEQIFDELYGDLISGNGQLRLRLVKS